MDKWQAYRCKYGNKISVRIVLHCVNTNQKTIECHTNHKVEHVKYGERYINTRQIDGESFHYLWRIHTWPMCLGLINQSSSWKLPTNYEWIWFKIKQETNMNLTKIYMNKIMYEHHTAIIYEYILCDKKCVIQKCP